MSNNEIKLDKKAVEQVKEVIGGSGGGVVEVDVLPSNPELNVIYKLTTTVPNDSKYNKFGQVAVSRQTWNPCFSLITDIQTLKDSAVDGDWSYDTGIIKDCNLMGGLRADSGSLSFMGNNTSLYETIITDENFYTVETIECEDLKIDADSGDTFAKINGEFVICDSTKAYKLSLIKNFDAIMVKYYASFTITDCLPIMKIQGENFPNEQEYIDFLKQYIPQTCSEFYNSYIYNNGNFSASVINEQNKVYSSYIGSGMESNFYENSNITIIDEFSLHAEGIDTDNVYVCNNLKSANLYFVWDGNKYIKINEDYND